MASRSSEVNFTKNYTLLYLYLFITPYNVNEKKTKYRPNTTNFTSVNFVLKIRECLRILNLIVTNSRTIALCLRTTSSCVTVLLGQIAGTRRSDRLQLNADVSNCPTASVPVIGLDGLDKSLRCKSDSHLARRVTAI